MNMRYTIGTVLVLSACSARERSTPVVVRGPSTTRADVVAALRAVPSMQLRDDGFTRRGERVASIGETTPDGVLRSIAVEPPRFADQPIVFADTSHGASGAKLAMTALGARHTAWRLEGGTLVADDVLPGVDALWTADVDRSELFYVLRDDHAPRTFRFALDAKELAVETEGTIAIKDGERVAMRIPRPFAIDARGVRRDAGMRLEGTELVVELDASGLAFPIVLDPGVETATWTRVSGNVRPKRGSCGAEVGGKFVLFGGRDETTGAPSTADTWESNGATWTKKLPATSPPARSGCFLAPLGSKLVLYGGYGSGSLTDTWQWDGTNWSLVTSSGPPMRSQAVFVSNGTQIVMFGGYVSGTVVGDTWVFDGSSWTPYSGTAPSPRYQNWSGRISSGVLLHGGWNLSGGNFTDDWLWNGSSWSLRGDSGINYSGYTDGVTAYMPTDTTGTAARVFDGSSWSLSSSAISGPARRVWLGGAADQNANQSRPAFQGTSGAWAFTEPTAEGWASLSRFSGGVWTTVANESAVPNGYLIAQAGELYVVTTTGTMWKRAGSAWTTTMATPTTAVLAGYVVMADKPHMFATDNFHRQLDGTTWTIVDNVMGGGPTVVGAPAGEIFIGTRRFFGGAWSDVQSSDAGTISSSSPRALALFRGVVHMQTNDGTLYRWNASTSLWNKITVPTTPPASDWLVGIGNRLVGLRKSSGSARFDTLGIFDGASWRTLTVSGGPAQIGSVAVVGTKIYTHWFARDTYRSFPGTAELWSLDIGYDLGTPCTLNTDCTSGFCTEGVCCDVATCGAGSSCNTVATKGTCRKRDGGACTTASECGSGLCEGGTCCKTACATATHTCSASGKAGTCLKRDGQPATSGAECASGFVADGVCCNTSCTGTCRSCLAAHTGKAQGACEPVAAGTDPAGECPDPIDLNSCGPDGFCNGSGACRAFAPETKSCGATTCASGTLSGPSCNGAGACLTGTKDCAPYQCAADGKTCLDGCTTAADCKGTGLRCDAAGKCVALLHNGSACTAADECASNNCVDGVCCNNACDGQCQACNVAGSVGTCSAVKGEPVGGRAACNGGGTPCAGSCDGVAAACTYPSFGTDCGTTCTDGDFVERKCDNKGTCVAKDPVDCNNYACGATGCKVSCTSVSDCAGPTFECQAGKCVPGAVATCTADGLAVEQDGKVTSCGAWRCRGGKCVETCTDSTLDCAPGHVCGGDGKCTPSAQPATEGDGGCAFGGASQPMPWLALALAALGAARRRRG